MQTDVHGLEFTDRVAATRGAGGVRVLAWALETHGEIWLEYLDERVGGAVSKRVHNLWPLPPPVLWVETPDAKGSDSVALSSILAVGRVLSDENE